MAWNRLGGLCALADPSGSWVRGFNVNSGIPGRSSCRRERISAKTSFSILNPPSAILFGHDGAVRPAAFRCQFRLKKTSLAARQASARFRYVGPGRKMGQVNVLRSVEARTQQAAKSEEGLSNRPRRTPMHQMGSGAGRAGASANHKPAACSPAA